MLGIVTEDDHDRRVFRRSFCILELGRRSYLINALAVVRVERAADYRGSEHAGVSPLAGILFQTATEMQSLANGDGRIRDNDGA